VIFNFDDSRAQFYRPDNAERAGTGSLAGFKDFKLQPNQWYLLRWVIRPDGMEVVMVGSKVFIPNPTRNMSYPKKSR